MNLIDESQPQVADPEVWVHGGRIEYKLNFKCPHENVEVKYGEVLCKDCNNQDLTNDEAVSILGSYLDMQEAMAIDNYRGRDD